MVLFIWLICREISVFSWVTWIGMGIAHNGFLKAEYNIASRENELSLFWTLWKDIVKDNF